jgi:hypothetical protein
MKPTVDRGTGKLVVGVMLGVVCTLILSSLFNHRAVAVDLTGGDVTSVAASTDDHGRQVFFAGSGRQLRAFIIVPGTTVDRTYAQEIPVRALGTR